MRGNYFNVFCYKLYVNVEIKIYVWWFFENFEVLCNVIWMLDISVLE